MFGYVTIYDKELKIRDYEAYRSYYCGLCHALKKRYGRTGQMLLNYDMTFLALLHSSLYEPEEQERETSCIVHPVRRHAERSNAAIDYAADMTFLLGAWKARDDWRDERSIPAGLLSLTMKRSLEDLRRKWPVQWESVRRNIGLLEEAERAGCGGIDTVSGYTGAFLADLFVWKDDLWAEPLRRLGWYLGKFVYLMDAWEDREKDRKKGNYNLFLCAEKNGSFPGEEKAAWDRVLEILTDTMACAAQAFEYLPVVANADILRNILYAGVWVKLAGEGRKEGKHEKSL